MQLQLDLSKGQKKKFKNERTQQNQTDQKAPLLHQASEVLGVLLLNCQQP
jgi:hypothetical protein